ncbi:MAG: hypothetical protein ACI9CQ_003475, partial [Saprospiraceae bacterium]
MLGISSGLACGLRRLNRKNKIIETQMARGH